MKELKFTETKEFKIEALDNMVEIKPYLLIEEINEIVNLCKNENPITRDMLMYSLIVSKCTNIQGLINVSGDSISVDLEIYNLYKINGIIDEILTHIDERYINEIEYYIGQYNSINQTVKDLSSDIETLLEKANTALQKVSNKGFNIKGIIEQLKQINKEIQ